MTNLHILQKPQTRSQAKVFSLKYWIPNNDLNPKWERYDIKDIAEMFGRYKWSVQHTLDLAIKNVSMDRVNLSCLIEVNGYVNQNNALKFLNGVTGDVYYQNEELTYTKLKTRINQNYTSTQEIDIVNTPLRLLNLS